MQSVQAHRSFYKEDLFFIGEDEASGDGALGQQIVDLLSANFAVGAVCGFYEDGYPVYCISDFALQNLDMSIGDFLQQTGGNFLELVFPEDRGIFVQAHKDGEGDTCEYRLIAKGGKPRWFSEHCTSAATPDGRPVWISSLRSVEESHLLKSEMLSKISHDMFTPLNAILGSANLIAANAQDDRTKDNCYIISAAASRLMDMINRAMELRTDSKSDEHFSYQSFSLSELMTTTLDAVSRKLHLKGQELKSTLDAQHLCVISDFGAMTRALRALLENASTFSPEHSQVELIVRELPALQAGFGYYEFQVIDRGIGIAEEHLKEIFEPFNRVEDTRIDGDIPHMGLGLTVAKQLVQGLGGNITVNSVVDSGSTFTIRVQMEIGELPADQSDGADLTNRHILVVEDNRINSEILCEFLEMEGAETVTARDGQEALQQFTNHEKGFFDTITMDIHMPVMDGYEATRRIRSCEEKGGDSVRIIAVTSDNSSEDVRRIFNGGMNAHIPKPVDFKALKAAITAKTLN